MRRLPTSQKQHVVVAAVAVGVLVLALVSTSAPSPREVYTVPTMIVWTAVLLGVLFGVFPRAPVPRPAVAAGLLLAAFTGLTALSMLWASDPGNAFDQVIRASGYTGLFVLVVLASRDGEGGLWLRGLAIGLVAVALVALAPRFAPGLFGSPDAELEAQGRIGYPIHYWNGLAALMAAAAALLAWLSVQASTRGGRACAAGALPIPLLVLYMAQSRGGLLASAVALTVLLIAGPARQRLLANLGLVALLALPLIGYTRLRTGFLEQPGSDLAASQGGEVAVFLLATVAITGLVRRSLDQRLARFALSKRATIATAVVAGVVALLALAAADPAQRFEDFKQPPTVEQAESDTQAALITRSGGGRWQWWGSALEAFGDEPLKGVGAGEFGVYWNHYGSFGFQVQNAHSLFLEALGELGLFGFLAIAGFFGVAIATGVVRASYVRDGAATVALALVAAGAAGAMFDFLWELPAVFAPIVLAAALLTGSALTPSLINAPPAPERPPRRGFGGLALVAATLAFGWASLVAAGLLLLEEQALDHSRDAISAGDFEEAIRHAESAVDLMPWSAEPRIQLGLAYQRAGDLVSAREATLEGIERADEDWRWWRQLALIDGPAGDLDTACEDIARARELNPRQALLYEPTGTLDCPGPDRPPANPPTD